MIWTAVEPQPGRYDDAYLARIERTVDVLHRHGSSASWTSTRTWSSGGRYQGQGFPDWAAIDDGGLNLHVHRQALEVLQVVGKVPWGALPACRWQSFHRARQPGERP